MSSPSCHPPLISQNLLPHLHPAMAPAAKIVKATKGGKQSGNLHLFFGPAGNSQSKATPKASGTSQVCRHQLALQRVAYLVLSHLPLGRRRPNRRHPVSLTLYHSVITNARIRQPKIGQFSAVSLVRLAYLLLSRASKPTATASVISHSLWNVVKRE